MLPGAPLILLGACISDYYHAAVARLRHLCLTTGGYARPMAKTSNQEAISGSKLVKPPHLRPVPEFEDMGAHVRAAMSIPVIQPEFDISPEANLVSAVIGLPQQLVVGCSGCLSY